MVSFSIPGWYRRPMVQVFMLGMVCFCTVGMFSALNALGAGGTQDIALVDISNSVLYGVFCIAGFFGGSINNILGHNVTLFIGTLGYMLYTGSLWCFQTQGARWFVIFAGAVLGSTAALLWSAQGSIMMSYPKEEDKGKAIGLFWGLFQAGNLIGSIIAFTLNLQNGGLDAVKTSTYLAFIVVMAFGTFLTLAILPPSEVRREDGSRVEAQSKTTVADEVTGFIGLFKNRQMLLLIPLSFASNFFYTYQGAISFAVFDASTRALGGILSALASIIGAQILGWVLDIKVLRRRQRAFVGLSMVSITVIAVWSCGIAYQTTFSRTNPIEPKINYKDSKNAGIPLALIFFYYIMDAFVQSLAYWTMASLTSDTFTLARFAGFYKAIQSGGAAIAFGVDAVATPYMNEVIVNLVLLLVSLPLTGVVMYGIKEHNEDIADTQDTQGNVDNGKGSLEDKETVEVQTLARQ